MTERANGDPVNFWLLVAALVAGMLAISFLIVGMAAVGMTVVAVAAVLFVVLGLQMRTRALQERDRRS